MQEQTPKKIIINNYGCGSGCSTIIAACLVLFGIGSLQHSCTGWPEKKTPVKQERKLVADSDHSARIPGKVERNLGTVDADMGSTKQAESLLQLINDVPNRTKYAISYQTPIDVVIFGADFEKNVLARMHNRPDGSGSAEKWSGYIFERLKEGANGGTLNQTPNGQQPGTYQSFAP